MPSRPTCFLAVLLLAGFAFMVATVFPRIGVTFDEPAHLTAGRAYWSENDYRLHPENGLLPQRLAALPAVIQNTPFPGLNNAAGRSGDVWGVARDYFFGIGNDPSGLLAGARALMVVLGVILLFLLWRWAHSLWGTRGGLFALAGAAFCPHLLAHSGLATSDIAAALGFMAALLAWWRLLHKITIDRILFAGAATTFLALAKFSSVLLSPVGLLLLFVRCARKAPLPIRLGSHRARALGWLRFPVLAAAATLVGLLTWVGIWAGFGFRYSASADDRPAVFAQSWAEVLIERPRNAGSVMADGSLPADVVELKPGIVQHFVRWARERHLLPEAYLFGFAFTDRYSRNRLAYFAGEFRESGWREFFPAAIALKTTLPALGLSALAVFALIRSPRRSRFLYRLTPLLLFSGIYWLFALQSSLNIGHRHLLPLYPVLYLLTGALALLPPRRWIMVLLIALLVWHAVESWRVRPHYLTYFNQLAGGPTGGHRYFVDSSLDWGQGLPDLKNWLRSNAADERVFLSYFGSDDPVYAGIHATRIGDVYFDHSLLRPAAPELAGGIYCVSATMLHRVYTQVRGPWSPAYESEYQQLQQWRKRSADWPPNRWRDLAGHAIDREAFVRELVRFEQLRFGRLCHFLQFRHPDAIVANSVFIYHLRDEEINVALRGPLPAVRGP
ncbi:MAG: glycosyltransferase family 39 protein [Candidatus Didemnitutus sp.]|nr:glycosyltransferase family 39 protein [Candidatus Didemnitutus sp.]